jgi:alkanesulfonate monooxygenase SsuD/methylene tetrahydromethanopterin reductase-like flavin-dependent oxidoreductase (luciferase family)
MGLAVGYTEDEFDRFGVPVSERAERIEDAIRVCRGAWSPGPLDYDSDFHAAPPDTVVTPKPTSELPLVLGAYAKPAVRRAARMGDGWFGTARLSPAGVEHRVNDIERIRGEEGLDNDFTYYMLVHGFVADSEQKAWETVRDSLVHIEEQYAKFRTGESVEFDQEEIEDIRSNALLGTPEQICEQLEPYRDILGDDGHVILRSYHPGIGTAKMRRCMERLGDEVAPEI